MQRNGSAPVVPGAWPGILIAPLALLICLTAFGAPAHAAQRGGEPEIGGSPLASSAGWHGRAIRRTNWSGRVQAGMAATRPAGWSAGGVRLGAGLSTPRESTRVKEVQRRLLGLGYAPGPVDGRFGRRTQAAVGWYQHKHGLEVTGAVTTRMVRHLRRRAAEPAAPTQARRAAADRRPDTGAPRSRDAAVTSPPAPAGGPTWWLPASLGAAAAMLVALALALLIRRRQRRTDSPPVYELWAEGHSPDPEIGGFRGLVKAVSVPDEPRPRGWVADSQYLVEDPTRPEELFWVPAEAIEQLGAARQQPVAADTGTTRALGYVNQPATNPDDRRGPATAGEQEAAIDGACRHHGWELVQIVRDSARTTRRRRDRPGLSFALERIAAGEASCLVVARLNHLTRSVSELGGLLDWFSEHEAALVICDIGLDTSTTIGRRTAQTLAAVSAWERERTEAHPSHHS
jgi:peptidoglycan hydrolase-like protein with peptidoglycan-binding domain